MASPAYLTAVPGNGTNGSFASPSNIAVTQLKSEQTAFYVVRHAAYNSNDSTDYNLVFPTSRGNIKVPQLSPTLTLNGRDSKIHVTDYDLAGTNLLYSTAEIFTWKSYKPRKVLILYGGSGEVHELAFETSEQVVVVERSSLARLKTRWTSPVNSGLTIKCINDHTIINWTVSSSRIVLRVGESLYVYLVSRQEAYNYWVLDVPKVGGSNYTDASETSVIVKAGYLVRSAILNDNTLRITGDVNTTTSVELVGVPERVSALEFSGQAILVTRNKYGVSAGKVVFNAPRLSLPDLGSVTWKYLDSLPEIQSSYDDALWTHADHPKTLNPRKLETPTSLYGSDYGFNVGTLIFRGHFHATGKESTLFLETQGGTAFGHSVWLNNTFIGSWAGISIDDNYNQTLSLPNCVAGQSYILTVVIDTTGLEEENWVGNSTMKHPRGILRYDLLGHHSQDLSWKITGNLGGEDYRDRTRGPLNEGGMYAERQGYHLPGAPTKNWPSRSPLQGIKQAGVGFFSTEFDLDLPRGYDIPLSFVFKNSTTGGEAGLASAYRVQLFVNGYQFGKYGINPFPPFPNLLPPSLIPFHLSSSYIPPRLPPPSP